MSPSSVQYDAQINKQNLNILVISFKWFHIHCLWLVHYSSWYILYLYYNIWSLYIEVKKLHTLKTKDESKVEELTISFYDAFINGCHNKDLYDIRQIPLEEFLSKLSPLRDETKVELIKNLKKEEIEDVVKTCT